MIAPMKVSTLDEPPSLNKVEGPKNEEQVESEPVLTPDQRRAEVDQNIEKTSRRITHLESNIIPNAEAGLAKLRGELGISPDQPRAPSVDADLKSIERLTGKKVELLEEKKSIQGTFAVVPEKEKMAEKPKDKGEETSKSAGFHEIPILNSAREEKIAPISGTTHEIRILSKE